MQADCGEPLTIAFADEHKEPRQEMVTRVNHQDWHQRRRERDRERHRYLTFPIEADS